MLTSKVYLNLEKLLASNYGKFLSSKSKVSLQCIVVCSFHQSFVNNSKSQSKSSRAWMVRQMNDPYVEKAKLMNYRCRSAFKLLEMNEKHKFLHQGQCVVECGAAPGSWTQILTNETNSNKKDPEKPIGQVISVDRVPLYHVEGATILGGLDFTNKEVQNHIVKLLPEGKADAILSDMAPNATGVKGLDQEAIINLAYSVLRFAIMISKSCPESVCLIKVWEGGQLKKLETDMKRFYEQVRIVKPLASRANSAEIFLFGKGFKGLKFNKVEDPCPICVGTNVLLKRSLIQKHFAIHRNTLSQKM